MKQILYVLLIFLSTNIYSQELSVKSFVEKSNDISARTYMRQDNNGTPCALVKVQLASGNAVFEGPVVGTVEYKTSEYWVYMPKGSKRLTVKLEGYLPLPVEFNPLESNTTYILTITGVLVNGQQQEVRTKTGWLIIDSNPQGAAVYINNGFVGNTPLDSYKQPYGIYNYKLEMPNYHSDSGTFELNSGKIEKIISLKPAFGSIAITGGIKDATVLLDGKNTGKQTPCTLTEVPSGAHVLTIQKNKYAPRQFDVTVEDGMEAKVSASLDARFAAVTIKSLQGAEILIDNAVKGATSCTLDLMEGYYDVVVNLAHHRKATKQIQVVAGQAQTITLNPTPIYGSLDVVSTPRNATITIDGKQVGQTPFTIESLLEGEHSVTLSLDGYASKTQRVTISEGETASLATTLQSGGKENSNSTEFTVDGICYKSTAIGCEVKSISNKSTGNVIIPSEVKYNGTIYKVTSIGASAFYGCSGLTSVSIPNSVTSIGNFAFCGCSGLTSVSIPNSVTSIGDRSFYLCKSLTNVSIPNSVMSIGDFAFSFCPGLTSITIPEGVTSIGTGAFSGCFGLTSITIPESVTSIGKSTFKDCLHLSNITIPESVTSIGAGAFYYCASLTNITIPGSVTSIGAQAFKNCKHLTNIIIPESVTSIGENAFWFCSGLKSVTFPYSWRDSIDKLKLFTGCSHELRIKYQ